jgi:hypothetical protein
MPHRKLKLTLISAILLVVVYVAMAYLVLPAAWTHYEHQPALAGRSMVTLTEQGIPGDPLNVGLVGNRADIVRAMHVSDWFPADAITLRTSVEIIGSVLLNRPYRDAPVSNLFYDGRKEDLAFEKPEGTSADRRHHVRFWRVLESGVEGRPVWLGSATFDRGVGLSRYTGQITHHIAPDVDADRDLLISNLTKAGMMEVIYQVSGVGLTLSGRNGGGDPYRTDGDIWLGRLVAAGQRREQPPTTLPVPAIVLAKDAVWRKVNRAMTN